MKGATCPNPRCKGGWVERGDNESGGAPAFPCRTEGCPHGKGAWVFRWAADDSRLSTNMGWTVEPERWETNLERPRPVVTGG